jgi:hypothetical protein
MNPDGLLSIDMPAGRHRVVLKFRDGLVTLGALITLGTLAALLVLLVRSLEAWSARTPFRTIFTDRPAFAKRD